MHIKLTLRLLFSTLLLGLISVAAAPTFSTSAEAQSIKQRDIVRKLLGNKNNAIERKQRRQRAVKSRRQEAKQQRRTAKEKRRAEKRSLRNAKRNRKAKVQGQRRKIVRKTRTKAKGTTTLRLVKKQRAKRKIVRRAKTTRTDRTLKATRRTRSLKAKTKQTRKVVRRAIRKRDTKAVKTGRAKRAINRAKRQIKRAKLSRGKNGKVVVSKVRNRIRARKRIVAKRPGARVQGGKIVRKARRIAGGARTRGTNLRSRVIVRKDGTRVRQQFAVVKRPGTRRPAARGIKVDHGAKAAGRKRAFVRTKVRPGKKRAIVRKSGPRTTYARVDGSRRKRPGASTRPGAGSPFAPVGGKKVVRRAPRIIRNDTVIAAGAAAGGAAVAVAGTAYADDGGYVDEVVYEDENGDLFYANGTAVSAQGYTEVAAADGVADPYWGDGETGPSIDLTVHFAYNSSAITGGARPVLRELGMALNDPALADKRFLIAGHTDAKGSDDYNMDLSFDRAQSVALFLVDTYGVDPDRLEIAGYGEEQLKNWDAPYAAVNRRVQIFNIGEATSE